VVADVLFVRQTTYFGHQQFVLIFAGNGLQETSYITIQIPYICPFTLLFSFIFHYVRRKQPDHASGIRLCDRLLQSPRHGLVTVRDEARNEKHPGIFLK
jgi:hypothetical protein